MNDIVYEPISLGDSCACKFQISRKLHDILYPGRSEASFRLRIIPPDFGRRYFGKDLFDWQGTPIDSVSLYLENDFQNLFEREDLEITPYGLFHRDHGTNFFHYFELADVRGVVTEERLEANYERVKKEFDGMCDRFREHLSLPGPFLYIHRCREFPKPASVERLIKALSARSPEHRFHLLIIGYEETQQDYSAFEGTVSIGFRTENHGKPATRDWEDNDAEWDAALAPFKLRPNPALLAALNPAPPPPPPQPEPAQRGGVLSRLLGRG